MRSSRRFFSLAALSVGAVALQKAVAVVRPQKTVTSIILIRYPAGSGSKEYLHACDSEACATPGYVSAMLSLFSVSGLLVSKTWNVGETSAEFKFKFANQTSHDAFVGFVRSKNSVRQEKFVALGYEFSRQTIAG